MQVLLTPEFQTRVDHTPPARRKYGREALDSLQAQGITSFDQLAASLPFLRDEALSTAIWALPYFDKRRTVPLLLKQLDHPEPLLRGYALIALELIGGARAGAAFVRHLEGDPDPWVREKAAHGLGFLFDSRYIDLAFEPLLSALANSDEVPAVRAQAAEGLGNVLDCSDRRTRRYKRAQAALIQALEDPATEVRFWAAFALGVMGSRTALPKLRQLAEADEAFCAMSWQVSEEGRIGSGWTAGEEASDAIAYIVTGSWPEREGRLERCPPPNVAGREA